MQQDNFNTKAGSSTKEDWLTYYIRDLEFAITYTPAGEKGARHTGWNKPGGYFDDLDRAKCHYAANPDHGLKIVHGPSETLCLDVDHLEYAKLAFRAVGMNLETLCEKGFVYRGRDNRAKIIFRLPEGFELSGNKVLKWPKEIGMGTVTVAEIRVGDCGDMLPPSVHPDTGQPYQFLVPPPRHRGEIAEVPRELLDLYRRWDERSGVMLAACPWSETLPHEIATDLERAEHETPRGSNSLPELPAILDMLDERMESLLEALGAEHWGGRLWLCPFHPDTRPSLAVYVFGDGRKRVIDFHGSPGLGKVSRAGYAYMDALDLYQKLHGLKSPLEAARHFAGQNGIELSVSTSKVPRELALTDMGNAELFARMHSARAKYVAEYQNWLVWGEYGFEWDTRNKRQELAKEVAASIFEGKKKVADFDQLEKRLNWARQSASKKGISSMLNLARSLPSIVVRAEALDADPLLLNVKNGVIDLRTGEFRQRKPGDLLTKHANVEYDPRARAPLFLEFLDQITLGRMGLVAYLKRLGGYCLTGLTREQVFVIFHGSGRNSKTTLLNILLKLLGTYATTANAETFMFSQNKNEALRDLARLPKVRLVIAPEIGQGSRLDEALVKRITGQEMLAARPMYGEYFTFEPQFKLLFGANVLPEIRGTDEAIWRRVHVVPFDYQVPKDRIDPHLSEKLFQELVGIFNFFLEGCLEWQESGLAIPSEVTAASQRFREESDLTAAFITEVLDRGEPNSKEMLKDVYQKYVGWWGSRKNSPMTQHEFSAELRSRGFKVERGAGNWMYVFGVRLQP